MKHSFYLCFFIVLLVSVTAMAQNKVVVVPMGSSAKGTDGQVQYNDNGRTAGAEFYYDKATGGLELPGELRTVDEKGNNRLWGKGRPNIGLLTHTDPNGYCTTSAGIKVALSDHLQTWEGAAEACPARTWVCSDADLPQVGEGGSCPIVTLPSAFQHMTCDGNYYPLPPTGEQTYLWGWVSDGNIINDIYSPTGGRGRYSGSWNAYMTSPSCYRYRVWCCWQ